MIDEAVSDLCIASLAALVFMSGISVICLLSFTVHLSGGISVSNARPPSVEPRNHLEMVLPASLQGVTQHHMDFIRCDELVTGVRVKVTNNGVDAVERTHFTLLLTAIIFATAKTEVKVSAMGLEYKFR